MKTLRELRKLRVGVAELTETLRSFDATLDRIERRLDTLERDVADLKTDTRDLRALIESRTQ